MSHKGCYAASVVTRGGAWVSRGGDCPIRFQQTTSKQGMAPQAGSLGAVEAVFGFLPVHDVPPGGDVFGPAVLVLEIIGVLPYIQPDDRVLVFHQRAVLVGGGDDFDFGPVLDQPRPARAEARGGGGGELLLELLEPAQRGIDGL